MVRAKPHQLRVTEADLYYEGSVAVDEELLTPPASARTRRRRL